MSRPDAGTSPVSLEFLHNQKTMVLATADPRPWTAPVYFVYARRRFYFFSSSRSRHITAAREQAVCAATVFRDSSDWRDIEGLQMDGIVQPVPIGPEAFTAFGSYIRKFPTVRDLFVDAILDLRQFIARSHTQLYAFDPEQVFYLNNQAGLGSRTPAELPA